MLSGVVKFFREEENYGFIIRDDGKADVYVNLRNVQGRMPLPKGAAVSFRLRMGRNNKEEAYDVRVIETANIGAKKRTGRSSFPYGFVDRDPGKSTPEAYHHQLDKQRLDVAFDVVWTTETPVALGPCEDSDPSVQNENLENSGLSKRWLMVDDRLAISPFTVKGAVANGVANLLGGCYRVPEAEVRHKTDAGAEGFHYTGRWKRYRVAMNRSCPGIIQDIDTSTGRVTVQPVTEYYLDFPTLPFEMKRGDRCFAAVDSRGHKHFVKRLSRNPDGDARIPLRYYGPYRFGMDLTLKPGDMNKKHYHRFYAEKKDGLISGVVPDLNFASKEEMLKKAHGGVFCKGEIKVLATTKNPRNDLLGKPWHQDLSSLKKDSWCYYTTFKDSQGGERIAGIGKNFQFKTFFSMQDAVPSGQHACTGVEKLCPRCRLFGVAMKGESQSVDTVGYAGRFRSATLKTDFAVTEREFTAHIPTKNGGRIAVDFRAWDAEEKGEIVRQVLFPIMGPPKPSKRDQNGYFHSNRRGTDTGFIKGSKRYHHAGVKHDDLPDLIDNLVKTQVSEEYSHNLRPIAPVCRENIDFKGTLGGANCHPREIAALLTLLDRRLAESGFKLGLGKSIGLGSVSSTITRIWVRRSNDYQWQGIDLPVSAQGKDILTLVKSISPEIAEQVESLINTTKTREKLNALTDPKARLEFPKADHKYWQHAGVETF